ncbi:MAG: nucleotidyl transferase AbiEii/AbiGii toxin family protein [Kiritimatiellae bacterium]|nr:nucleotidyl transferase AbiEii/AbiGii toxin family protein [Kiritimatiellia bacterium]
MIQQAYITAWRSVAPWPDDAQVEQDLALSRAVVQIFQKPELAEQVALRGGTSLSKLFIRPACRYSEDIDLVQTQAGPAGPLIDAIRQTLDPWLGKPSRARADGGFSMIYRFDSEIAPVRPLRLKIEVNTREHFTVLGVQTVEMKVTNPWFSGIAPINTYRLDELMGTKLRALYQRRKGRDLFDLWLCLSRKLIDPQRTVHCFLRYMTHESHPISRAQFEQNLHDKQTDAAFMEDIAPLLNASTKYDPSEAVQLVHDALIARLPGDPWRGPSGSTIAR